MSTAVQLCSRALVMVGANPITALDGTDTSTEATVAAQIYESAVRDLLSRYRWRFASKQEIVVATVGSGVARWEATFDIPADCLVIHALTDEGTKIEFDRYGDKIGANAAADASLVLDYGYRAAESEWPAYFDAYVELHLAAIFAFSIANQLDLSDYLEKKAARAFTFAKTQDTQGRTAKKLDTSRFLQTRGFATGEDDYISSGGSGGSGLTLLIDQIKDGTLPGSSTPIAITNGGTGAATAANARTNLGLGTMAVQNANNVAITGGSITGASITLGTALPISSGGTGATDAATARSNLGLGTIATQAASNVSITGGSITGITDLAVADGGTGASTAADARTNLGLVIGTDVVAQSHVGSGNNAHASLVGATSGTAGVAGFVPAPAAGDEGKYLRGDGTWQSVGAGGTVTSITAGTGLTGGTITTSGTIAIDSTVATLTGTQTLTNKTLTSPTINTATVSGGTINNAVIGGTTPAAGTFTTISDSNGQIFPLIASASTATTSGTSFDFTGIPSWAKRVILTFNEVSLDGTDDMLVRLGTSGGMVSSGYVSTGVAAIGGSSSQSANNTSGFIVRVNNAARAVSAHMVFVKVGSSDTWISSHFGKADTDRAVLGGGSITLSGTLTQLRLTRTGTNNFDAGSISIQYEG